MKHASIERLAKARPPHLDPNAPLPPVRWDRDLDAVFEATDTGAPRVAPTSRRRFIRPRTVVPALATMAAIAVAAVVTVEAQPGSAPSSHVTAQDGKSVLLAAAVVAAKAPAVTDRYWVTADVTHYLCGVKGAGGAYVLSDPAYHVSWADVRANVMHSAWRDRGAKPLGEQGEKAWRKSGAPTSWGSPCKDSMRDTGWDFDSWNSTRKDDTGLTNTNANGIFPDGTLADLQRLPTDPAKLRAYFIAKWPKREVFGGPGMSNQNWETYSLATQVLEAEPAPPAVRSAAYKVIANLPGVHVAGTVTDPLGRRGIAVYPPRTGSEQDYFVFDPATSQVLSDEKVIAGYEGDNPLPIGTVADSTAYLTPTWTNTPPNPKSLHFPRLPTVLPTVPVTTPSASPSVSPSG